ncbi:DUF397 domain-containing protein [Micromonospora sp. DT4]|uniref:DUF397 domain-containing protein n=1 Tax=Micromonospora sp. DT4 TaxID=3393438 RepID=UPI003CF50CD1
MTTQFTGWRKSTRSDDGNCVEVANANDGTTGVRDSKDINGPVLAFHPTAWNAFVGGVQSGAFNR